jgi:hypothetical protein
VELIEKDTIGWRVADTVYKNKWEAIGAYMARPADFAFYYYDNLWDTVDWSVEPEINIQFLELARCRELRKQYKIIVLAYSGGVDSHTVLTRFLQAGLHIDYIYCSTPGGALEIGIAAAYLNTIQHLMPNTKILLENHTMSFIDVTESILNNSIFTFNGDITKTNAQLRFHHVGYHSKLKIEYPEVYNQIEENSGCVIMGSNKPFVEIDDLGQAWYTPLDKQDENVETSHLAEFFWTGSNPLLQLKQCHMAKQWLKKNNMQKANSVYQMPDPALFTDLNLSFGREPPMHPIFAIKNCFGAVTKSEYIQQEYGLIGNNFNYAKLIESNRYNYNLKKLQAVVKDFHLKAPELVGFKDNNTPDVHGWYGKPRFLGI